MSDSCLEPYLPRDSRQRVVISWVHQTFGVQSTSRTSRILRFLEEAIELSQAEGLPIDTARTILEYVYARPKGLPDKEAGQVGLTLLAYCESIGVSAEVSEIDSIHRALSVNPEHWRQRQEVKIAAGIVDQVKIDK